jgi:ABC-type transport system involved in cytochrome c biogenesis permease subunit
LSLGLSNASLYQYLRGALGKLAPNELSVRTHHLGQLSYRAMQFGTVLLAAGTILGGVWADYSWGRFWGWDPKETWALIALLCYLAVLHGRFSGWVTQFGFALWGVICFMSVLMAWYGVNFVLGVGLHSYGFSSGGISFVLIYMGIQLAFVLWVVVMRKIQKSKSKQPTVA